MGRLKKEKTITPGLRIDKETWKAFTTKYPRKVNQMFSEWVKELILDNQNSKLNP